MARIRNFSKEFVEDVIATTIRIHQKDQKAFPFRICRSVAKRFKGVHRYKITLLLNYLAEIGMFQIILETPEEFRERMQEYSGLYKRGARRKYFHPASSPANCTYVEYSKLTKEELEV